MARSPDAEIVVLSRRGSRQLFPRSQLPRRRDLRVCADRTQARTPMVVRQAGVPLRAAVWRAPEHTHPGAST